MRSASLPALLSLVLATLNAGCGDSSSVGQTFQSLGGSGGNSTGGQGGAGAGASSGGSTTSSSTSDTSTGGSTTTSSSGGSTTTDTGTECMNGDKEKEPNDTESEAQDLGTINDKDSNGESISGVIAGAGDVDWFKYSGEDDFLYSVDPTREFLSNGFDLRICKFIQCTENAVPEFGDCPGATTAETSPGGRPGCCGTSGFTLDFDCSGTTNDSATVYIRVDSSAGEECAPYTVNYHF